MIQIDEKVRFLFVTIVFVISILLAHSCITPPNRAIPCTQSLDLDIADYRFFHFGGVVRADVKAKHNLPG